MWKVLTLLLCMFCTNGVRGTYNTAVEYQQQFTPTHNYYHQYGSSNNNKDYQTPITHQYVNNDNSYQQQQHEGSFYQQSPTSVVQSTQQHHYQQQSAEPQPQPQPQPQPIYERRGSSQQDKITGNWQNSENSITEYYTGCPSGHTGQLPYAYDCRRFLNCWHGRGHIQTCSVGTVFNPETLECDRPDKVKCEAALSVLEMQSLVKSPKPSHGSLRSPNYKTGRYTDTTSDNVEVLCPAEAEGLQPHPSDCTRFINCANGNMHIQQCGPGTAFSVAMKVCDFRNKVDCSGREGEAAGGPTSRREKLNTQATSSLAVSTNGEHEDLPHTADILCLKGITGLFSYPFDYTKFINCKNGNTAIQNCVAGTAFSISKGYCESLDNISQSDYVRYIVSEVSYEYSQTLITCPPGTEGLHLYPFNAEIFVKCIKSQMKIVPCSSSQVFSIPRRSCLPLEQVLKHERVRLLSELNSTNNYRPVEEYYRMQNLVYCPGGLTGMYPHPFDSTKYLKCERGRLFSESCASGEAFSFSRKRCSLKEELNVDDHVPQAKVVQDHEWRVSDMEITHGSIDGLTYIMCPTGLEGYFLHPFDCTKYIECSKGATVIDNCLNGAVFSISRKECIPRDKVKAYDRVEYLTTTKNEFSNEAAVGHDFGVSCSSGTFGTYPHPQDHQKYVRCANGRISVENCPVDQVFSVVRSFCHNENEVNSNDRSSYSRGYSKSQYPYAGPVTLNTNAVIHPPSMILSPPLSSDSSAMVNDVSCPAGASGRYSHPNDCTKFLMCSNGRTQVQDCGPGTAWNKAMEVCDFRHKVGCYQNGEDSTLGSHSLFPCPAGIEGHYQHPYDWHKYLVCNNDQTRVMDCTPGTVFSLSRKSCDVEANVLSTDRTNNGVYISDYDYNLSQMSNTHDISSVNSQSSGGDTAYNQSPTNTHRQVNRWKNMNIPRPEVSTHDHTTTWQHTSQLPNSPSRSADKSIWSGTGEHTDPRNPTHTVIYEEGSFLPNRNYNHQMFNTPLAPLKPLPTTTSTSTIVYAQPIGSQENSREIFGNTPTNPLNHPNIQQIPTSNRDNHTRQIHTWKPIRPVDIPRHNLMPPIHSDQNTVNSYTHEQIPITTHLMPPHPDSLPSLDNNFGHNPLTDTDTDFKEARINIDNLPGQKSYNLDDFDQLPSASLNHDINDASNLYVDLQPPFTDPQIISTPTSFLNPYPQTTQVPVPPSPTTPTKHILEYPLLSNATLQTFPNQPHYSSPYSEVAHSYNASWMGRKIPHHSIKTTYRNPLNNEKGTSTTQPLYYGVNSPSFAVGESEGRDPNPELQDQEVAMNAALKLLLKPYQDKTTNVNDDTAVKAQTHIMSLVSITDLGTSTTTTHKPLPYNRNTVVPSTTPHQEDVELILAGEQHSLVGITTKNTASHETTTPYNLHRTTGQSERSTPLPPTNTHNYKTNWHKHHTHDRHHLKLQHSRDFHDKHPNLPNPFADATSQPDSSYNSRAEATTTRNYNFDLRSGGRCPFECGNGKCVEQHQVCDGVNNCENRKDEQQCDHLGYQLRLTGGHSSNMGRVEVKILGKWGYVCDDKFGLRDADVVCRELGFKMGAMEVRGNSYYAPSDVNLYFTMDEVECNGTETSVRECDFKGWGVNNCGPDEVVGVVCKVQKLKCPDNYWLCSTSKECIPTAFLCDVTPDCEDGSDESEQVCNAPIKYRLEGGRSSIEGRLEVFYRGEWGTICDDDFGLKEAQVVCNSFGLYGRPELAKNIYGPGSGPIWLDQVSCFGNETSIDECNHWSWGENNCNHTEDVGLKCTAGPKPNPLQAYKSATGTATTTHKDVESPLQFEQSELDDLGLYQGLWQRSSKAVQSQKKCGRFKSNVVDEYEHPEERVVNGSIAKRGRHPWQATIRTRGRGGISSHWCGAVIISKKLILTAAHCLAGYPKGSYFVRMGDHYANIAESSEIDSNIENWYIHEKFRDQKHMNNDIALILLKTPVRFNDYVQPICLPGKGVSLEANRMCTISGWGSIKSGTSTPSNILRSAQVPILSAEVCSQKNVYANAMTEGMFCAGFLDESADACDGDSGGPLVCSDDDGETLYGIISWGQHCGYANHPGVYVRVEKYIDWIYEKINLMMQQGKL